VSFLVGHEHKKGTYDESNAGTSMEISTSLMTDERQRANLSEKIKLLHRIHRVRGGGAYEYGNSRSESTSFPLLLKLEGLHMQFL
jgi:hypothetical protein